MAGGAADPATVVVASTDDNVVEVLARIIETDGHRAVRTSPADDAPSVVLSASADAAVLDLGAANPDQLDALRTGGSERGESVRVVVIATGPASALVAWHAGADAVLTRPFPAEDLLDALASSLAADEPDRQSTRDHHITALSS
jgi:DNA-binding response OmpR family regulator